MNTNVSEQPAQVQEIKTVIYKGRSGWEATSHTPTDANGQAWQISTHKTSKGVSCSAVQGTDSNGMFSYMMFGAKRLELSHQDGQCNEKKVREVHAAGLIEFERIQAEEPAETKPAYIVGIGQIIFTDSNHGERERVIYEVVRPGHFKTVSLDGDFLTQDDYIRPYSEKFGIGVYYKEGEVLPLEEVQALVIKATEATKLKNEAAAQAEKEANAERAQKIEQGEKIISAIPEGVKSVIVAKLQVNDSDPQSDYFSSHSEETVFLSWSTHERDIFSEMRKAAAKFEPTAKHATCEKPADADQYWTAPDEHREKYSMGSGYYLGDSKYHGWIIKKIAVGTEYGVKLETLQVAAAEGKFLCGEIEETVNTEPVKVEDGKILIIKHPKRAGKILVVGRETYEIKDKLKSLGGWWNKWEKGWEYKEDAAPAIIEMLQSLKKKEDEVMTGLKQEVEKTIQQCAEIDREIYGSVSPLTLQCAAVQNINLTRVSY